MFIAVLAAAFVHPVRAQRTRHPDAGGGPVTVDEHGVMRWTATGKEVALFGVNYTTPFAYAYRAHGYLGVDRKQAIDADVTHLARLGVDAFRVHVWDREVSDREGNLDQNEHLDLLDYLVARMGEHGIRTILTPIAWWGTGYPEPDPHTNGLSDGRTKGQMTTDPAAWKAEANYLRQFVSHVNPYTGSSYADDPNLIAVEIINEPSHPGGPEETTRYIDSMVDALRETGFHKPIFYNISQGYDAAHGHAVCAARIQGVSNQWYPTGLVRNSAVGGNMLPNVDRYTIPYGDVEECRDKARMVYEFDAADEAGSYMYPAMARSFRTAGFQWATQFAYDPLALAYSNTEYQTHFLNLVYTPRKAISFMIAGAAFHALPRGSSYGAYPKSERFGPFRVSYADDLSEMVTDTAFYYSNDTGTTPPAPGRLRHVAGVGSSSVVSYPGTGSYFLDRLSDGVWRLEVYPDAVWVVDPFTRPSLGREAVRILWRTWPMTISLPDLGTGFSARPLNAGNDHRPTVEDRTLDVRPGAYLLTRAKATHPDWTAASVVAGRPLDTFVAPAPSTSSTTVVLHTPPTEVTAGRPFAVETEVVAPHPVDSVALFARQVGGSGRMHRLSMASAGGYRYRVEVPAERVRPGLVDYVVTVYQGSEARTFPGGDAGDPTRWDFTGRASWRVNVVPPEAPVLLFDAGRDLDKLLTPAPYDYVRFRTGIVPGSGPERSALRADVRSFAPAPHHFALRTFLTDAERTRLGQAGADGKLRVLARTAEAASDRMRVALVERDGTTWGTVLDLTDRWKEYTIPLSSLQRTPLALLPRPYPQFLPYLLTVDTNPDAPDPAALDGLQFSTSAALFKDGARRGTHGFEVERVVLEPGRAGASQSP